MFKRSPKRPSAEQPKRYFRPCLEQLEDRTVPHSGATLFSAGITANAALTGITRGPDNNFWFAEFGVDRIGRITPVGVVTEFTLMAGSGPTNITVGPDGNLWFTENTGNRIGRINPFAGSDAAIQASIVEFVVPGADSGPNGITSGPDGNLWFTQSRSDEIGRINTTGTMIDEFVVPGAGSTPAGITSGPDGALWFTEAGSGEIGRITTAGMVTNEFVIPVAAVGGFSDPESITVGPGGALFFTEFGADRISRITTAGAITQFNLPTGRGPSGIVALPDGDLYFTEAASGRIGRLPASALIPGKPTSGAPPLEEFDFIPAGSVPLGITSDASGDIWFTLNAGNAIGNFLSHLTQITVTATGTTAQFFNRNLQQVSQIEPFPGFGGSFSVAVNDVNGNGVPDGIFGAGAGGAPHVKVFDGSDNRLLASFYAFDPGFTGGISLAADDVNGDGRADIIVSAGVHVKIIDGFKVDQVQANGVIADSALLASFFAFAPGSVSSVSLASYDFNNDGRNDIVIGAGPGGGPHVKVIDAMRVGQVQANGVIAESALLASFYAFTPSFTGGVFVAVGFNDVQRKLIVSAGPGGTPHVKVIDGTRMGQVLADGQIADSALLGSFFAFAPSFGGGVRVSGDDLNSDGAAEIILSAGPGGGPHVKVIDGSKLGQVQSDGQIAESALLNSFFTGPPGFSGGVFIAADADHRDGPTFGPPGITITNSQRDINDIFIFQSPVTTTNSVLAMTVSPFSTATTPAAFVQGLIYDFRVANRDIVNVSDDLVFRVTFGPADAAGVQDVAVRALPAARFPGIGGVLAKGFTGQNLTMRGFGPTAQFRAAEQDDPFLFDAPAFNRLLNGGGFSTGTAASGAAGNYPNGTSNGGAGDGGDADALGFNPGETPDYNAPNFFANANTLAIVIEIPSTVLAGLPASAMLTPDMDAVGFWGRTEANGVQLDRMGRPAINTALIPPVPRGSNFPIDGSALNRFEQRNAFNAGHPRDDRAVFSDDMAAVLVAVYPIGGNGQAPVVAGLLLPDILVYDPTSNAGFFGDTVGTFGMADFFLAGGRKFSDDVVSVEVSILTDPDTPFNPAQSPLVTTQNVADDNGLNLMDGSMVGPGSALTGMLRASVFPYIGARNPNPSPVPGAPPPP